MQDLRYATLSGSWYPASPDELAALVDGFLEGCKTSELPAGRPLVAVVPHAGYAYSGSTAGKLFGLLAGFQPRRIIILAPNHRHPLQKIGLSGKSGFQTPLGTVTVDQTSVAELRKCPAFTVADEAHDSEHAIEIQLPFLQRIWPQETPTIVPLLVPQIDSQLCAVAAAAIQKICHEQTLLLVSTDFTHFGSAFGYQPFSDDIPLNLERLDSGAILKILAGDGPGLREYWHKTGITMCGLQGAALALDCGLPDGYEAALLDYRRSADRDGDFSHSVSYAAVLICSGPAAHGLDPREKEFLWELAWQAVTAAAKDEPAPDPENLAREMGLTIAPQLREKRGAFVTLTRDGELRGCIGYIEGFKPLLEAVLDNGRSAAVGDPRFSPVKANDLAGLEIEVSALTPLRPVKGPEEIEIGRHGIVLKQGPRQAVFLPQVAVEQGWDLPTTLTQLALKAGLLPDAWRHECQFQVFEAEIISKIS